MSNEFLWLALISGYIVAFLVGAFAFIIAFKMFTGSINIDKMLCEKNGDSSLSRFQFMIFTFVISMCLVLLVIKKLSCGEIAFPEVPAGVWALLGISGGSYAISKGIQKKAETEEDGKMANPPGWPNRP